MDPFKEQTTDFSALNEGGKKVEKAVGQTEAKGQLEKENTVQIEINGEEKI